MPATSHARAATRRDAEPRPSDILADAGIHLRSWRPGTHRLGCPECAEGKPRRCDDALSVTVADDGHAVWLCHRCGWKGTTRAARSPETRDQEPARVIARPEPPKRSTGLPAPALALWGGTRAIRPGTVAATYLANRACALPPRRSHLRWHPDLWHPRTGNFGPALVALVTDPVTACPMTLHRTWLAPDGSGKAAHGDVRRWWPNINGTAPKAGGICRLWPDEAITLGLCIGEGLESSLAAAAGFGTAWATLDAANMAAFPVLNGLESLTIVADHDPPHRQTGKRVGIEAAKECARRWRAAGKEVRLWKSPTEGADFADFMAGAA